MKRKFAKATKVWAANQSHGMSTLSWFLTPESLRSMKRERLLDNIMHRAKGLFSSTWPIHGFWTGEKRKHRGFFVRTTKLSLHIP